MAHNSLSRTDDRRGVPEGKHWCLEPVRPHLEVRLPPKSPHDTLYVSPEGVEVPEGRRLRHWREQIYVAERMLDASRVPSLALSQATIVGAASSRIWSS